MKTISFIYVENDELIKRVPYSLALVPQLHEDYKIILNKTRYIIDSIVVDYDTEEMTVFLFVD